MGTFEQGAFAARMQREFWTRQQGATLPKFGFDLGVLLQADFSLLIQMGDMEVMTSRTWVIDSLDIPPSRMEWSNDAETFGMPMPSFSNAPCSITFLTKSDYPLRDGDGAVGDILRELYASQFDPQTGLLALPVPGNKISFVFALRGSYTGWEVYEEEDGLTDFPIFRLVDVRIGTPQFAPDPKSMAPLGIKVPFVYKDTIWRDFNESEWRMAQHQSTDDAIHEVKLFESRNNNTNNPFRNKT